MSRGAVGAHPGAATGRWIWIWSAASTVALAPVFLPVRLWTQDVPMVATIVRGLQPWRWDWPQVGLMSAHTVTLALAMAGAGWWPTRWIRRGRERRLGRVVAAGAGALGLTVLGAGLLGLVAHRAVLLFDAVAAVGGFAGIRSWWLRGSVGTRRGGSRAAEARGGGSWRWIAVIATLWCALFIVADWLAPEAFWDALSYHLGGPQRNLEMGKIVPAGPFLTQMPALLSMDFLVALAVQGEGAARGVNLILGLAGLGVVYRLGRRWEGPAGGWIAVLLAGTTPLTIDLMIHADADLAVAAFAALAVEGLVDALPAWPRGPVRFGPLVRAGAWLGLAVGAKLPAAGLVLVAAMIAWPCGTRAMLALTAPAGLVALPWAVKSWLLTGNPVFPLLAQVFPSPFWSALSQRTYGNELSRVRMETTFEDFLPGEGAANIVSRFKRGLLSPTPLLAALAMLFPFAWRPGRRIVGLLVAGYGLLCGATVPVFRYFSPGFVLLPLLLPTGGRSRGPRALAGTALVLNLGWLPLVLHQMDSPWAAARGEVSREEFYANIQANEPLDASHLVGVHLGAGPRVRSLSTGDVRTFLLPPWSINVSYFEPPPLLVMASESRSASRLRIRLRQRSVRFLIVNVPEMLRLNVSEGLAWDRPMPQDLLSKFFSRYTRLGYARFAAWVYLVEDHSQGSPVPECFLNPPVRPTVTSLACITQSQQALSAGDVRAALANAWSAVSRSQFSGLAWVTLADALAGAGRDAQAEGAYERAMELGWQTSVTLRNYGMLLAKQKQYGKAWRFMETASALDPEAIDIRRDFQYVHAKWLKPLLQTGRSAR